MRTRRMVESILVGDVAGLAVEDEGQTSPEARRVTLERARRRALVVVILDWLAILVLLLSQDGASPLLTLGPTEATVLAIGLLAVATHAGFRLGQLEKYCAVSRALEELGARDAAAG